MPGPGSLLARPHRTVAGLGVGEQVVVLVESVEDDVVEGRAAHQGPEVDGTTMLTGATRSAVGDLVTATVTGTDGVDLIARMDGVPA